MNGHHWDPCWPEPPFPGDFQGEILHSHYYRVADPYIGKRVLVLGFGNSAVDIATETSRVSTITYLAVRRGFHILPKYILGKPLDQLTPPSWVPFSWQMQLLRLAIRLQVGNLTEYQPASHYPEAFAPDIQQKTLTDTWVRDVVAHSIMKITEGKPATLIGHSTEVIYRSSNRVASARISKGSKLHWEDLPGNVGRAHWG